MAAYTFDGIPAGATTIGVLVNVYASFVRERVLGIIDTGSSTTCISHELADTMGLQSLGKEPYTDVNNVTEDVDTYNVDITIDDTIHCGVLHVGSYTREKSFYDVIIGMDILSKCDFAITSASGHMVLTMEYPSKRNLDFTKE